MPSQLHGLMHFSFAGIGIRVAGQISMQKIKHSTGQASLEYLLVLIAAFAFLGVSFHFFGSLQSDSMFWLDIENAKAFAGLVASESRSLSALGDGSSQPIESKILGEWKISGTGTGTGANPGSYALVVVGSGGRKFSVPFKFHGLLGKGLSGKAFSKRISLVLEKSNGAVLARD